MRPVHLSASAIRAFLHCPNCFRYAYIEGVRPEQESESQRMGTNWHAMHEVYRVHAALPEHENGGRSAFDAAIDWLNQKYSHVPDNRTEDEWELERTILASSFAGHVWYYQNNVVETLATEVPFEMPLFHPRTGLPLPSTEVVRVGKIDRIIRREGLISISDYKSTSKAIDANSEFWDHLRLDAQISMYVMAAADGHARGMLGQYGIQANDRISGAFYDVWRKPQISPKMLTQKETADFVETGKYMESVFRVEHGLIEKTCSPPVVYRQVFVDGKLAEVEEGKKGFAIRETIAMFGARLLADIYSRPEFYFARKEIPRTDDDLRNFRRELYNIWQNIKSMRNGDWWYRNDQQDNMLLHGDYGVLCYHNVDVSGGQTPPGFRRIFNDQKESA